MNSPVYNDSAEASLLGCFINNREYFGTYGDQLVGDDFFVPAHKRIFAAFCQIVDRGEVIRLDVIYPLLAKPE